MVLKYTSVSPQIICHN